VSGSMKLKAGLFTYRYQHTECIATTELKRHRCQFVNWLVLLLAMVVIEKIIKCKNRYYRFIRLVYSGLNAYRRQRYFSAVA